MTYIRRNKYTVVLTRSSDRILDHTNLLLSRGNVWCQRPAILFDVKRLQLTGRWFEIRNINLKKHITPYQIIVEVIVEDLKFKFLFSPF